MSAPTPRRLTEAEIIRQLGGLTGVERHGATALALTVEAPSFEQAITLVVRVATDAETMNHHPDIDLRWRTVTFVLTTHSAGGITQWDVELAHQILAHARALGAELRTASERREDPPHQIPSQGGHE